MPGGALAQGTLLPDELWGEVFCHLRPKEYVDPQEPTVVYALGTEYVAGKHSQFHRLRSVCKRFNQIFNQHHKLLECLYLKGDFQHTALPSLLLWSLGHKCSIRTFIACCGSPCTEVALAFLSGAALDAVVIRNPSPCTISTLAAFASVTTVDLHFSGDLDLTALHMLHSLKKLHLRDGVFAVGGLAAHMTYLFLDHANVTSAQSCSFVTGLQQLELYASSLVGLDSLGVSACTALTWLALSDAEVGAEVQTHYCNIRQGTVTTLASGLFSLTNLTHLDIEPHSQYDGLFDTKSLLRLRALNYLRLDFKTGRVQIELCAAFTRLLELEVLIIWLRGDSLSTLTLNVAWHKMSRLKAVNLTAKVFKFEKDILGFTQIKGLEILFLHSGYVDGSTAESLEALRCHMARFCPDVLCQLQLQLLTML